MQAPQRPHLERLLQAVSSMSTLKTAVVHPIGATALNGAIEAAKEGLVSPIFVGPQSRIENIAKQAELEIGEYEIINTQHSHDSAKISVEMARDGQVAANYER